ncbi:MAG: Dam family site-specific DNA-(adenine-N6)-methyltransferase [Prevotellaceae bacterium]|jgi:DNA adenine methylase|nr:Dam family site-specific DNA-(adenine-N6)-methyltransferase [Prevotellaceae bacterium]
MKPLVKYRGGKSNEIPNIERHIPHYKGRYIEPFFGGGALYFHLEPKKAIINDINTKLMAFYKGVKSDYPALRKELDEIEKIYEINRKQFDALKKQTPNERVEDKNEELYYQIRDMFNDLTDTKYSDALLYFFINKTAYSGMIRYNSKGEFNVPFGRYTHLNTTLVTKQHSDLLQNADIFNSDYKNIFSLAKEDDFMFLDPPYDCVFSDYGNEEYKDGFNDDCHIALAQDFKNLNCKALLVIGRTPLTEKLYGDMIIDEYAKNYSVNIRNRFKSAATHILVANYETDYKSLFYN